MFFGRDVLESSREGFRFGRVRGWASVAATRSMPIIDRQAEVGLERMGTIGRKQTRTTVSRRKME